jgi:hypothetical protein
MNSIYHFMKCSHGLSHAYLACPAPLPRQEARQRQALPGHHPAAHRRQAGRNLLSQQRSCLSHAQKVAAACLLSANVASGEAVTSSCRLTPFASALHDVHSRLYDTNSGCRECRHLQLAGFTVTTVKAVWPPWPSVLRGLTMGLRMLAPAAEVSMADTSWGSSLRPPTASCKTATTSGRSSQEQSTRSAIAACHVTVLHCIECTTDRTGSARCAVACCF